MKPRCLTSQIASPLLASLLACALGQAQAQTAPEPSTAELASYQACMQRLSDQAPANRVRSASFSQFTQGVRPDMSLLDKLKVQPEFSLPIWDYMAGLVDEERIADGQAMLRTHADVLSRVQRTYGVDPASVVAVWGVESNYGKNFGKFPLVQALSTLACFGRRQEFFQGELFATLRILQGGHIAPEKLSGSWAGAFGHTQFMPTTFERLAVDFDGDGRRDLIDSTTDALASTANFLKRAGWQTGQPWGFEVRVPADYNGTTGRRSKQPLSYYAAQGLRLADGRALADVNLPMSTQGGLMLPAGNGRIQGPAFITLKNFDAFYSYNAAESYGLAIAHLSDRLRGRGDFVTPWPTDDAGLSRSERRELQTLLILRGHDIGEVDGALGPKSREAIAKEQARLGQPDTGRGGQKILKALRD